MYPTVLYPTAVLVAISAIAVGELFDITATTMIEIAQVLATTLAINVKRLRSLKFCATQN